MITKSESYARGGERNRTEIEMFPPFHGENNRKNAA